MREGTSGPDGAVSFRGMASGVHVVRADRGDDHVSTHGIVRAEGLQGDPPRTALLLFGTAAIEGTVLDAEGRPRPAMPVSVSGGGAWTRRHASAVTDAAGHFRIAALYGGTWSVQATERRSCTLPAGAVAHLVFGGPAPPGVLRGRIVDAHGGAVGGRRRLRFRDAARYDERQGQTGDDGTFRAPLPPGTWQVLSGFPGRDDVLATAAVGDGEARCEVCWPGVRLLAVLGDEAGLPFGVLRGGLTLRGNAGRLESDGFVAEGRGHVQWLDVPPGDYTLQVSGARFADAGAEEIPLRVTADRVQRVVVNLARR